MRYLNTKSKCVKVTNTEIKWLIISKSVMIIIFVEFIDQLIDYPINCTSLNFLLLVPWEICASWLWHFLGIVTYIFIPCHTIVVVIICHTIVKGYYGFTLNVRVFVPLSIHPSILPSISGTSVHPFFVSRW